MKFLKDLTLLSAIVLLGGSSLCQAQEIGQIFGEQRSESGIKHSFLVTGGLTAILDEDSRVIWKTAERSRDGFVLPNGNVLVSHHQEVREYTREGEVVFRYSLDPVNKEMGTSVRLDNGNTLIVERGPKPRLLEVSPDGKIAVEVPLQPETANNHMQTRMARKLANGNYLVPHLLAFAVKEYAPDGKVVKTFQTKLDELGGPKVDNWPFTAIRLENGNTLVNLTHGNKTVEFDSEGKIAWLVENSDVAGRFADPCGGQRLANGNTVICSYGQKAADMAKVFEITRDKKVVWEYVNPNLKGVHEIHVISTNGEAVAWPPMK